MCQETCECVGECVKADGGIREGQKVCGDNGEWVLCGK